MSSTQTMIVEGSAFNASSDITYTKPKVNASGGKNVGILNTTSKKSTYLSTPLMMTWGVNEYVDDKTGRRSYELSLQFPREQDSNFSNDTKLFLKNLIDFENKIKADAISNSKDWMNKTKLSEEVVDALWTPMLKYPKDQETGDFDFSRPPTLRVKIPFYDEKFGVELYDMNEQQLFPDLDDESVTPLTLIQKTQNIAIVIQNGGIWFANGKFGTTWKLVQGVVQPRASLKGKCHIKLDSASKQRLATSATSDNDDEQDTAVVDSDEEDVSVAEEVAKVVEVEAPPKKKVVRKKKVATTEA
tara:strand:+ start:6569 stop:7471 length:903 start_codon:yes stop_codon:yes gene_type:complete